MKHLPKQWRWKCLHCGKNHRWEYDHWYTENLGSRPFACECDRCFEATVVQMVKPGLYKSVDKHEIKHMRTPSLEEQYGQIRNDDV